MGDEVSPEVEAPEGMLKLLVNVGVGMGIGAAYGSVASAWKMPHTSTDGVQLAVDALPSFRQMWTHVGGNAMMVGGVAATYTLAEALAASVRGEYDIYTTMTAAGSSGVFMGARTLSATAALFYGVGFSLIGALAHASNGSYAQDKSRLKRSHEYR